MGKRIRRQHTVSRFYLEGFTSDSGRVKRLDVSTGEEIVMSVADASVVKDFYSFAQEDGTVSDYFEHAFSEIEGAASSAFKAVREGVWPLEGEPRLALAMWVALQHMRGEGTRNFIGSMEAESIRLVVGASGKEALRHHIEIATGRVVEADELDQEWRDITKPGGPDLVPDPRHHLRQIVTIVPGFASYLAASHWTLVGFTRKALLTSDHPVALEQEAHQYQGIGIATADRFTVPLHRRSLLTIQPRHRLEGAPVAPEDVPDLRAGGSAAWALLANYSTAREARRYIYQHPEDVIDERIPMETLGRSYEVSPRGVEAFIDERGLFADAVAPSDAATALLEPPGKRGFSLRDVPWPLPRRRYPPDWPFFGKA